MLPCAWMPVPDPLLALLSARRVVLFMEGTPLAPRCACSAAVAETLDGYDVDYDAVELDARDHMRRSLAARAGDAGLPLLYVAGELVGGADAIRDLHASGRLGQVLGVSTRPAPVPLIELSARAADALRRRGSGGVRLRVDRSWRPSLCFDEPQDDDVVVDTGALRLRLDPASARRADGATIDWVDAPAGGGFAIDLPHAPPGVHPLAARSLKRWMDGGKPIEVFDVRAPAERARATIEGSVLLDASGMARLRSLGRDTTLVLYCDSGARSRAAAEHCVQMGFTDVYDLEGGIAAFSGASRGERPRKEAEERTRGT